MENATVSFAIMLQRWAETPGATLLLPSTAYGGVKTAARHAFGSERVFEWPMAFPETTHASILTALDAALASTQPTFALVDHISSQPAIVCPVAEMVVACRRRGVAEVAVDGAATARTRGRVDTATAWIVQ